MVEPGGGEELVEVDRGLAAERTELAWGRSALAVLACGAALVKGIPGSGAPEGQPLLGVVVLTGGGLIWLAGLPLAHRRARPGTGQTRIVARSADLIPITIGTAVIGAAGLVIAALRG